MTWRMWIRRSWVFCNIFWGSFFCYCIGSDSGCLINWAEAKASSVAESRCEICEKTAGDISILERSSDDVIAASLGLGSSSGGGRASAKGGAGLATIGRAESSAMQRAKSRMARSTVVRAAKSAVLATAATGATNSRGQLAQLVRLIDNSATAVSPPPLAILGGNPAGGTGEVSDIGVDTAAGRGNIIEDDITTDVNDINDGAGVKPHQQRRSSTRRNREKSTLAPMTITAGQSVSIRYRKKGLNIEMQGIAVDSGRKGHVIRVRSVGSGKIMKCTVMNGEVAEFWVATDYRGESGQNREKNR